MTRSNLCRLLFCLALGACAGGERTANNVLPVP
jgi:hypothetical protein